MKKYLSIFSYWSEIKNGQINRRSRQIGVLRIIQRYFFLFLNGIIRCIPGGNVTEISVKCHPNFGDTEEYQQHSAILLIFHKITLKFRLHFTQILVT